MYEIIFYETINNKCPIKGFLEMIRKNTSKDFIKISQHIDYLRKNGVRLNLPICKGLKDGLYELRPSRYRIIYFYFKNNEIVLLRGFYKESKEKQSREIEKARKEMEDWKRRK